MSLRGAIDYKLSFPPPPFLLLTDERKAQVLSKLEEAMKIGGDNCILTGPSIIKPRQWQLI